MIGLLTPGSGADTAGRALAQTLGKTWKQTVVSLWFGVWAPAATSVPVLQQVDADIARALQDPEPIAAFARSAIQPRSMERSEFAAFVCDDEISK